ncbi:MAG: hypothetical protein RIS22_687, partial [Actinomycetota bacterium]
PHLLYIIIINIKLATATINIRICSTLANALRGIITRVNLDGIWYVPTVRY